MSIYKVLVNMGAFKLNNSTNPPTYVNLKMPNNSMVLKGAILSGSDVHNITLQQGINSGKTMTVPVVQVGDLYYGATYLKLQKKGMYNNFNGSPNMKNVDLGNMNKYHESLSRADGGFDTGVATSNNVTSYLTSDPAIKKAATNAAHSTSPVNIDGTWQTPSARYAIRNGKIINYMVKPASGVGSFKMPAVYSDLPVKYITNTAIDVPFATAFGAVLGGSGETYSNYKRAKISTNVIKWADGSTWLKIMTNEDLNAKLAAASNDAISSTSNVDLSGTWVDAQNNVIHINKNTIIDYPGYSNIPVTYSSYSSIETPVDTADVTSQAINWSNGGRWLKVSDETIPVPAKTASTNSAPHLNIHIPTDDTTTVGTGTTTTDNNNTGGQSLPPARVTSNNKFLGLEKPKAYYVYGGSAVGLLVLALLLKKKSN